MTADAVAHTPRQRLRWLRTALLGLFGLFYAYAVWNAVSYLISLAQLGINLTGWLVLVFAVLLPILVFAGAFSLGRRRGLGESTLVLLAGLGLVAVFWMNVVAFSTLSFASIKG